jgi:hypothetical protein
VIGSVEPWYEAICLAYGALECVSIDYNAVHYRQTPMHVSLSPLHVSLSPLHVSLSLEATARAGLPVSPTHTLSPCITSARLRNRAYHSLTVTTC